MKNRNWYCYALDRAGITSLVAAAIALAGALWFGGSMIEGTILEAFRYCLGGAVGALLAARVCEIAGVMRRGELAPAATGTPAVLPRNVEHLPARERLPRAA